jgi:hypothetical protein
LILAARSARRCRTSWKRYLLVQGNFSRRSAKAEFARRNDQIIRATAQATKPLKQLPLDHGGKQLWRFLRKAQQQVRRAKPGSMIDAEKETSLQAWPLQSSWPKT